MLVYDDAHVVVIDKPSGVNSVPYEDRETGTAMDLDPRRVAAHGQAGDHRRAPRRAPDRSRDLGPADVRQDQAAPSSGSRRSCARTRCERSYVCVAHGAVTSRRIESYLVADRGDGLRGSTTRRRSGQARGHPRRGARGRCATRPLCEVRLETGKTHQIRIHLAEAGHPLVGEPVYIRDYAGPILDLAAPACCTPRRSASSTRSPARGSSYRRRCRPTSSRCERSPDSIAIATSTNRRPRRRPTSRSGSPPRRRPDDPRASSARSPTTRSSRTRSSPTKPRCARRCSARGPPPRSLLAELAGAPVGFALFFQSYSTFLARPGLYLEDLFVEPDARGRGVGVALMSALARIAVERDYGRFEWSVLDWNKPSLEFYARARRRAADRVDRAAPHRRPARRARPALARYGGCPGYSAAGNVAPSLS